MSRKARRGLFINLLVITGSLMLLWSVLVSLKSVLAAPLENETYLDSAVNISLPLPQAESIRSAESADSDLFFPLVYQPYTPTPTPTATPTPTPVPDAGPVIRVVIPRLDVDRAVVPLKQYRDRNGQIQYDTDALYATANRPDLVGQLQTSVNPGDGSNIVLVGHNYNRGWYAWEGVFLHLDDLREGDKIILHTEKGEKHVYRVKKSVQVPWLNKTKAEIDRHMKLLGPSPNEKVTLVTCGGPFGIWSARIYVVAK